MPSLAEVQQALRLAVVSGAPIDLQLFTGTQIAAATRLDVHRSNHVRSLTRALEKTFPAVAKLVDPRFFAYCANEFVALAPPTTPCLFEYGATFPRFLESFPACRHLTYLSDVARLEWTIHAVFHELDAELGAGSRWIAPGLRILRSTYPVERIWQVALGRAEGVVDLACGEARLVIYQDDGDVSVEALGRAPFAFLEALADRGVVAAASNPAGAFDPAFRIEADLPTAVVKLLSLPSTLKLEDVANV